MDEIILLMIVISTVKCVRCFNKGFKEMIIKQRNFEQSKNTVDDLTQNLNRADL